MGAVPDWSIQIAWWLSGICATGAFWYFLSKNSLLYAVVSGLGAVMFAVGAVVLHRRKDSLGAGDGRDLRGVSELTGDINLTNLHRGRIEVTYPKPFASKPNLAVDSMHGSIELEILEERTDGFVLRGGSATWGGNGLWIRWTAKGVLSDA
jgi:hypothetical protein